MTNHSIDDLLAVLPDRVPPDEAFEARLRARLAVELAAADEPVMEEERIDAGTAEVLDLDTMTETQERPTPPARNRGRWLAAAAAAVVAIAVVSTIGGDDDGEVAVGEARTVFEDGFDDDSGGWLTEPTGGLRVVTGEGRQTWELSAAGVSEVQRPLTLRETLLDMEVSLDVVSVSPGDTVAALCRKGLSAPSDHFYAFRIGAAGASIVALRDGGAETLATDPSVVAPSGPFALTARCVDGPDGVADLRMSVDDVEVLTASDPEPIGPGVGAIQAEAGTAQGRDGEIVLDRIVVRQIEG